MQEVLIVAGKNEVLVDGIRKFVETLRGAKKELTVLVAEGESHDAPIMDLQLGYREPGEQSRLIRSWLGSRL